MNTRSFKIFSWFLFLFCLLSHNACAADNIGAIAAVIGKVTIERDGEIIRVRPGFPVFENDKIMTGGSSRAQVLLMDQTAINVGQKAEIVLDKFVFNGDDDEVVLEITKGTFKFISGKVATKTPDKVNVETPVATIGVRGTEFVGQISASDSTIALLDGKISVANEFSTQFVTNPGFGVTIDTTGVISTPVKIPQAELEAVLNSVSTDREALLEEDIEGGLNPAGGPDDESESGPDDEGGPGPDGEFGPGPDDEGGPGPDDEFGPGPDDEGGPGPDGEFGPGPDDEGGPGPEGDFGPGPEGDFGPGPEGDFGPGPEGDFGPGPEGDFGPGPEGDFFSREFFFDQDGNFYEDIEDFGGGSFDRYEYVPPGQEGMNTGIQEWEIDSYSSFGDGNYTGEQFEVFGFEDLSSQKLFGNDAGFDLGNELVYYDESGMDWSIDPFAAVHLQADFGGGQVSDATFSVIQDNFFNDFLLSEEFKQSVNLLESGIPVFLEFSNPDMFENESFTSHTLQATDSDGDPLTFSIVSSSNGDSPDADIFSIDPVTGEITFPVFDFENPLDADKNNIYNLILSVTDGVNVTSKEFAVTVFNLPNADPNDFSIASGLISDPSQIIEFIDWNEFGALAQDGVLTFSTNGSFGCGDAGVGCVQINTFDILYKTQTKKITVGSTGTFQNINVLGSTTSGSYILNFVERDINDFVNDSGATPGQVRFTNRTSSAGVQASVSGDTVSVSDSFGNSILATDLGAEISTQFVNISNSTTFGAIGEVSLTPTNVDGQDQSVVETSILNGQPVVTDN